MVKPFPELISDPPPMPDIRPARIYLPDVKRALDTANAAWNKTQLLHALKSIKHFVEIMETELQDNIEKGTQ